MAQTTSNPMQALASIEALVDLIPGGVAIVGSQGSVLFANDEARRILETDGRLAEAMARVLAGETLVDEPIPRVRPGAGEIAVELSGSPIRDQEGLIGAALLLRDVSARERRVQAERDFVMNAAHELQTPIAAITSAIEVLQRGAKERRAERDRFLAHIEGATDRLARLTSALLILARAQIGDEPRREIIPVEPMLRSVAQTLGEQQVDVACPDDVGVIASKPLLEQIVVNLGENAVKHSRGGVLLSAELAAERVTISVTDSGPGIEPSQQAHVFERFYRADTAAGFGLGLAIARDAATALGGELELESGPDGTRVSLTLPGARVRTT